MLGYPDQDKSNTTAPSVSVTTSFDEPITIPVRMVKEESKSVTVTDVINTYVNVVSQLSKEFDKRNWDVDYEKIDEIGLKLTEIYFNKN